MASKDSCSDAIASAVSDMDEGTEVTIELTGTVSVSADGTKTITGCTATVENESVESAEQEAAENAAVPAGVVALSKKKPASVVA